MESQAPEHDPRRARTREVHVVMLWDKYNQPEVICATSKLAQDYIAGQWSDEGYSVEPMLLVEELPERRPLWLVSGRLPYPTGAPTCEYDDFAAQGEFPGLGNGQDIALGETKGSLEHHRGGWSVQVSGWDRAEADARFDLLTEQAMQERARLVERFGRYTLHTVVRAGNGAVLARELDQFGTPGWMAVGGNRFMYDQEVEHFDLEVLVEGGSPR